ncbi:MAG: hypothetical protein K2W85_09635 [Phycisphaerales bacterium]|nr:hypothetical protein [Phycisphaerales bacterium]
MDVLLRRKGGFMPVEEAKRAMQQLLGAVQYAHEQVLCHGPIAMNEVHVDRRGSLVIELYGVVRLLTQSAASMPRAEVERREVQSVFEIGYQLVTGLRPDRPIITAGRVLSDLDQSWDGVFETGLGDTRSRRCRACVSARTQAGRWGGCAGRSSGSFSPGREVTIPRAGLRR